MEGEASIFYQTLGVIFAAITSLVAVAGIVWTIVWAIRGPKLTISLLDPQGYLTTFSDNGKGPPAYFFHIRVKNTKRWLATNVRLKVTRINKKNVTQGDGELPVPVCLIWSAHPESKLYLNDVLGLDEEACNLGYISREDCLFKLDAMDPARYKQNERWPPHFDGFLSGGESMQIEVVAIAENNTKSNTLVLDIAWDGQWQESADSMPQHLVIKVRDGQP